VGRPQSVGGSIRPHNMARIIRTPGAPAPVADETLPVDAAAEAVQPVAELEADDGPAPLPNAIDIDAKTIKGPVLTAQGWVCPDETGRDPKGPR